MPGMWYNSGVELLTTSVTTVESAADPYVLVTLSGEADATNSDELWEALQAQIAQRPRMLVIDLGELRFMDSSALHVLLRATRSMDRQGGIVALARPQGPVARMLQLTAADQFIPVYDSVAEATAG